jgi:hypothetical protein
VAKMLAEQYPHSVSTQSSKFNLDEVKKWLVERAIDYFVEVNEKLKDGNNCLILYQGNFIGDWLCDYEITFRFKTNQDAVLFKLTFI